MKNLFLVLLTLTLSVWTHAQTETTTGSGKKFKRALVLSGGGMTPAVGLGILNAAEQAGWKPDVIISTCGASMSAAIYNAYLESKSSLAFAQSREFLAVMQSVKVETSNVLKLKKKFDGLNGEYKGKIPPIFSGLILNYPEKMEGILPVATFNQSNSGPRFIVVSAQAHFKPADVGQPVAGRKLFTQALFTDPDTAELLKDFKSPIAMTYPDSFVTPEVAVISNQSMEVAARAGFADPFLLNPSVVDDNYYFTGALDLFPTELANSLADEVFITAPVSLFKDYEDLAIMSTFGFKQTTRALQILNDNSVKWIDMNGMGKLKMDPAPQFLTLRSQVPSDPEEFKKAIQKQFDFGSARMQEALQLQMNKPPTRKHLREPISPALYKSFTCDNAYLWETSDARNCNHDGFEGCDRKTATSCTPLR